MRKRIRKYFLAGMMVVSPVLLTVFLFLWSFRFLDGILGRHINKLLLRYYGYTIPGLGIIFAVALIFFAGFFVTHLVSKRVLRFFENWFVKFPLIKQVYPAVKEIVSFLFSDTRTHFKTTALVEYPRKGIYALGFITNDGPPDFNKKTHRELLSVFIPTTPTPLSGFLIFVPKEEVIVTDVSVESALKIIISGGVVLS